MGFNSGFKGLITVRRLEYNLFCSIPPKKSCWCNEIGTEGRKPNTKDHTDTKLPTFLGTQQCGNLTLRYFGPDVSSRRETQLSKHYTFSFHLLYVSAVFGHHQADFEWKTPGAYSR